MQVVTFRCAGERGGVPATAVREIARMVAITPLPAAPPLVEGVIDVRGETVPVLDVRRRLGLPPRERRETDYLIVAAAEGRTVALHVDEVDDLVDLDDAVVQAAAGAMASAPTVSGVARLADGLLVLHDVDAFLSASEADALDQLLEPPRVRSRG